MSLESLSGALKRYSDALKKAHKDLKVQFDTLRSNSKSTDAPSSTKAFTSKHCARCKNIDVEACVTNVTLIYDLKDQVKTLKGQVHQNKK